ncbi:MAG: anti-sigma factor [Bacteroidota bacterium]
MNIEAYIASGILELYVAGMLSDAEIQEVQQLSQQYPKIQAEIKQIEEALEEYAGHTSGTVPGHDLLKQVMDHIDDDSNSSNGMHANRPAQNPAPVSSIFAPKPPGSAPPKSKLPPEEEKEFLGSSFYSWAATILLVASLGLNVFLYMRQQNLQKLTNTLIRNNSELKSSLKGQNARLAVYEDTAFQSTSLLGTDLSRTASAVVYWNRENSNLFLKVNSLPTPGVGEQYQLWALQNGTPVNAGVLESLEGLQEMQPVSGDTQAFAVTLESLGGRENPSLDQMYLIGDVGL